MLTPLHHRTLPLGQVAFQPVKRARLHVCERPRRAHSAIAMAAKPAFEAWVKGDPEKNILGDCPFCHRALLTLEEKKATYEKHYINLKKKPDWLLKLNPKGSVPAIKDLEADKWHTDSGEFVDFLEDKIPQPKLGKAEDAPAAGSKVLPSFVQYLDSSDSEAEEKKANLLKEFDGLEQHLKSGGPFLKGSEISAGDLVLAPRLYHSSVALKHFKNLDILADYPSVKSYFDTMKSRDSWKKTQYGEDIVIQGWQDHIEAAKKG